MRRFLFGLFVGCVLASTAPALAVSMLKERLIGWSVWEGRVLLCTNPVIHHGVNEIRCTSEGSADD
uniref:hypothetical protein n=1 Tax=Altererythrobacter segetis TaxID=1104773 RepID=UPI00140A1340|nr:hypothetical protein [Altererythrobacter segetis]